MRGIPLLCTARAPHEPILEQLEPCLARTHAKAMAAAAIDHGRAGYVRAYGIGLPTFTLGDYAGKS